jgi:hypothetical protein
MSTRSFVPVLWGTALLAAGACLLPAPEARAFRCGDEIVSVGDAKSRVQIVCGNPTFKERTGAKGVYAADPETGRRRAKSSRKVEQWTYNCGEGDFIYVLTFEGGRMVREDTKGRGRGKSGCRGN